MTAAAPVQTTVTLPWRLAKSLLDNLTELRTQLENDKAVMWWEAVAGGLALDREELERLVTK